MSLQLQALFLTSSVRSGTSAAQGVSPGIIGKNKTTSAPRGDTAFCLNFRCRPYGILIGKIIIICRK